MWSRRRTTWPQTLSVVAETPADVILFEAGLSPTPAEAVSEVARRAALPAAKLILVTQPAGEQETVDYLRRGVRGILTRTVSPELLVRCVRKVAAGETWLDKQGVNWVIQAYRSQALQGNAPKQQLRLSEKEMLIISGVTQGLKNKDIAREVGTTEQVVKNYLRKIYDKLQVADRLELALYSMHHRLLDGYVPRPAREPRQRGCGPGGSGRVSPGGNSRRPPLAAGHRPPQAETAKARFRTIANPEHYNGNPGSHDSAAQDLSCGREGIAVAYLVQTFIPRQPWAVCIPPSGNIRYRVSLFLCLPSFRPLPKRRRCWLRICATKLTASRTMCWRRPVFPALRWRW